MGEKAHGDLRLKVERTASRLCIRWSAPRSDTDFQELEAMSFGALSGATA
jgi:hypothetical protein